jgi:hypothetical protein
MNTKSLLSFGCACLALISVNVNAALISKQVGTVAVVYDDDLNITWLADANLAASNTFDVPGVPTNTGGALTWVEATNWIAGMNSTDNGNGYQGFTGWRLPTTLQPDSACSIAPAGDSRGFNCSGGEMGHLYYIEGITASNPGLFSNVQSAYYWSGTEFSASNAWRFSFDNGQQGTADKFSIVLRSYAWAVHDGDIGVVPVPAAVWLFASGLLGLIGVTRRKS